MSKYAVGLDFGTNSCRSLIVDIKNGNELSTQVFNYPSGDSGIIVDSRNPNLARQNPADYILGIESTIKEAIEKAKQARALVDYVVQGNELEALLREAGFEIMNTYIQDGNDFTWINIFAKKI